ncbi:ClbS/DfsB family four-helix bundle protein [Candidatus Saccharibacteria bacterium]|nr:ClbS/DfsB family four-helix bundle protein [Candidatus Saccharibacteria bacterium]MBR3122336.1 ClbS/DfsB family four-helix bundle protein [Candidatus Saccharibacteria bacterium]
MPRPRNKKELLAAANDNYNKLIQMADSMTEKEMNTPFDFSNDPSKKERHWGRDKNLRDIWIHLYEWHQMLLKFVDTNLNHGGNVPFLPAPYTWKTYGDMNVELWKKHQKTSLEDARKMFEKSHQDVLKLAESLSEEQLFEKGMYPWVGSSVLGAYFISCLSSHYDWAMKKLKAHHKNCA